MEEKTAKLLIRIVVELANWLIDLLKNKRKEKTHDDQGTTEERRQS